MALRSLSENNGDKENKPNPSSTKPLVAFSKAHSFKKRKLRMPLEDITNLYYPGFLPSLQESPLVLEPPSLLFLALLVYQLKNRCRRDVTRKSDAAAATLRKHFR